MTQLRLNKKIAFACSTETRSMIILEENNTHCQIPMPLRAKYFSAHEKHLSTLE